MKEYKSNEDLINYLISKGVIIENKKDALSKIEKYTYYAIVNTYKEVFKGDGKYFEGVTFNEIYSLYNFDKNLRAIFLKYALEIEVVVKSLIANTISKKYGIENYLDRQNFDINADTDSVKRLVHNIEEELNKNYGKHPAITHYQNVYGYVPPFVLVKVLTLGEISRFYGLLKQEDRQAISKYFKISDKLLLDKKHSKKFQKQIYKEITKLSKKLKSISIRGILDIMGYPSE